MSNEQSPPITPEMIANLTLDNVTHAQSLKDVFINNMAARLPLLPESFGPGMYNVVNRLSEAGAKVTIASRNEEKGRKAEGEFKARARSHQQNRCYKCCFLL